MTLKLRGEKLLSGDQMSVQVNPTSEPITLFGPNSYTSSDHITESEGLKLSTNGRKSGLLPRGGGHDKMRSKRQLTFTFNIHAGPHRETGF